MAILGTQILQPISPTTLDEVYPTHYDEWGHGGYVAITTNAASAEATSSEVNAVVLQARRKTGMLVYDNTTSKYYRCTNGVSGAWVHENFGEGTISSVQVIAEDGLSVSPSAPVTSGSAAFTVGFGEAVGLDNPVKMSGGSLVSATVSNNGTSADFAAGQHTQNYSSITGLGGGGKLLGHTVAGSGAAQLITIGTGLTLEGNELKSLDAGGTVTTVAAGPVGVLTSNTNDLGETYTITHDASGVTPTTSGTKQIGNGTTVPQITVNGTGHVTVLEGFIPSFLPLAGGTVTGSVNLQGVDADLTVGGDLLVTGTLTVNGEQTIVNSTTIEVADKDIVLASGSTTDAAANGGGIILKGGGDKTLTYSQANDAWQSNIDFGVASGRRFEIGGLMVLDEGGLGSGVVDSSLTSVGILTSGTWNADVVAMQYGGTGSNLASAAAGSLFKKGSSGGLEVAILDTDYLNENSPIDGGSY